MRRGFFKHGAENFDGVRVLRTPGGDAQFPV